MEARAEGKAVLQELVLSLSLSSAGGSAVPGLLTSPLLSLLVCTRLSPVHVSGPSCLFLQSHRSSWVKIHLSTSTEPGHICEDLVSNKVMSRGPCMKASTCSVGRHKAREGGHLLWVEPWIGLGSVHWGWQGEAVQKDQARAVSLSWSPALRRQWGIPAQIVWHWVSVDLGLGLVLLRVQGCAMYRWVWVHEHPRMPPRGPHTHSKPSPLEVWGGQSSRTQWAPGLAWEVPSLEREGGEGREGT